MKKIFVVLMMASLSFAKPLTIDGFTVFESAGTGSSSELKLFLDKGVDVNIKDEDGESLLYYACLGRKVDNVKLLLQKGANVKAKNNDGATILESCIILPSFIKGREEIVKLLKLKGAK